MGLLDKLWDDIVAGPQPEQGLGRLRKQNSMRHAPSEGAELDETSGRMMDRRRSGDFQYQQDEARRVTQSIAIAKPPMLQTASQEEGSGSLPSTPVAQSPVSSWSSPSPRDRENIWRSVFHPGSNKAMDRVGSAKFDKHSPNSPTVYDWVVISALDK